MSSSSSQNQSVHDPRRHPWNLRGHLQRGSHADVPSVWGPGGQRAPAGGPRRCREAQHAGRDHGNAPGGTEENHQRQKVTMRQRMDRRVLRKI